MRTALTLGLVLALFAPAFAGDTVEIKPGLKKGFKITRTTSVEGKGTMTLDMGSGEQKFPMTNSDSSIVAEEVLEVTDGKVTSMKRRYSRKTEVMEIEGVVEKKETKSPLLGKVLTITLKDGKAVATRKGADKEALKKETFDLALDEAMAPGKPVAVGAEWQGDAARVKAWMEEGQASKIKDASMECKLEGVEEKFGQKCAKIHVTVKGKGTTTLDNGMDADTASTLSGTVWFGLESGRSLGMEIKGKMEMSADQAPNGGKGSFKVSMNLTVKGSSKVGVARFTPLKKK